MNPHTRATKKSRSTIKSFHLRRIHIIPTVFSKNKTTFTRRFNKLKPHCTEIQVDLMDGRFVPIKSISVQDLPRFSMRGEAHLMVENPTRLLPALKKKGFYRVIAHIEALSTPSSVLAFFDHADKFGLDAGLALNPETPWIEIKPYLNRISVVLFLGVHPGKEGQSFIRSVIPKIKDFHRHSQGVASQVDGGINLDIAKLLARAGVRRFNTGSYTANSENVSQAISQLRSSIASACHR